MATVLLNISMALGLALRSCGRKRTLRMGPLTLRPPDEPARLARCLFLSQRTTTLYDGILTWLWQPFEEKKKKRTEAGRQTETYCRATLALHCKLPASRESIN